MAHQRRKDGRAVWAFLQAIRQRYPPTVRILLIMDNLSTHTRPELLTWCRQHRITPVFTPTYASWMNRIEAHFTAAHYSVIKNNDHPDHASVGRQMQKYLRWRNRYTDNAKLKRVQNRRVTL